MLQFRQILGAALAVTLLFGISQAQVDAKHQRHHKAAVNQTVLPERYAHPKTLQAKIAGLVYVVHPNKGAGYAESVASAIIIAAKRQHVPPLVVATSAYVESEMSMSAKGGLGIMQISPGTYREHRYNRNGLHARRMADNIMIGATELSLHYRQAALPSRGGYDRRLAITWGRYNGAGASSHYVHKSMMVYRLLKNGDPASWQQHLRHRGVLWK